MPNELTDAEMIQFLEIERQTSRGRGGWGLLGRDLTYRTIRTRLTALSKGEGELLGIAERMLSEIRGDELLKDAHYVNCQCTRCNVKAEFTTWKERRLAALASLEKNPE